MPAPPSSRRLPETIDEQNSQAPTTVQTALVSARRLAVPIITSFAVISIISASYVGLNGSNVWRQSDSYSQILGMLGQPGLGPLDLFHGHTHIFDIPIYQVIVAALAFVTRGEPLVVVRILDAVLFVIFVLAAVQIADKLKRGSGLIMAALLATAPLFLHFFATPLPDLLSLTCSAMAVMLLVTRGRRTRYWLVVSLLIPAILIKSPVPFVFLAFYVTWTLVNRHSVLSDRRSWIRLGGLLIVSSAAAIGAEVLRSLVNHGGTFSFRWYFGVPSDRISFALGTSIARDAAQTFATRWLAVAALLVVVFYLVLRRIEGFRLLLPVGVGFASGWLVFTNLYIIHNYYGLPTMFMLLLAVSIALRDCAELVGRHVEWWNKVAPFLLIISVPLMIAYGYKVSKYSVTSEGEAIRYVLRDAHHFVYVSNEAPEEWSPVVGGLAAKPFTLLSPDEFERSCTEIFHEERAVVINRLNTEGPSKCFSMIRESAVSFVDGPQYRFLSW